MTTNNVNNESNPIAVTQGGQGNNTLTTAYGVLTAGTVATGPVQTVSALGAAATVLTSGGPSAMPSFLAASTTNVTVGGISGNWYASGSTFNGAAGASQARSRATGTLYFHPIFINKSTIFTKIGILVGGTVAGNSVLGLYNDSGNSSPTGSPIANSNSGSIANVASTFSSFTFGAAITLNPGMYWAAHSTSGTTTFYGPSTGGFEVGGRGLGINATPTAANFITPAAGWSQAFTYNATLPTVGTLTSTVAYAAGDCYVFIQAQ